MRTATPAWGAGLPTAFFFAIVGLLVALSIWSVVSAPATLSGTESDSRSQLAAEVRALMGAAPEAPKYGQPPAPTIPRQVLFGLITLISAAFAVWALLNTHEVSTEPDSADAGEPQAPPAAPVIPEWMKAAFRESNDAILAIDASCRIISANPAAERLFGYGTGKLAGRVTAEVLPEIGATSDTLRRFSQVAAPARASGRNKDGVAGDVRVSVKRLADRPDSHFVAFITAMQEAPAAAASETPAAASAPAPSVTIAALAPGAVNPTALDHLENQILMTAGYGEMLLSGLPEESPGYADALASVRSATRAALLCHELKATRPTPQPRPVELNRFLADAAIRLQAVLDGACDIEVLRGTGAGIVHADPELLERALCSLALHAREWSGGISSAKISASKTRLDLRLVPVEAPTNPPPSRRTSDLLPAVDWIEAQGGAVEMEEHSDTGIRFRLLLPAALEGSLPEQQEPRAAKASAAD